MILATFFDPQNKDTSICKNEMATEDIEATDKMGDMVGDGDDGEEIV